MKAKSFEYARQVWVCTIIMSDMYMKPCDINGGCDKCEWAELEKQRETEDREEGKVND